MRIKSIFAKKTNMKRFLISLFMAIPVLSFAQSNFKKGYLVTNNQDTLKGFIDYRERQSNPTEFNFRREKDGVISKYTLENCSAYAVEGFESYRRFTVQISLSKINVAELSLGIDTTTKREPVFLKVLQQGGHVSLYSYTDDIKKRFYIQEKITEEPEELINLMYVNNDHSNKIVLHNKYIRQIAREISKFRGELLKDENKILRMRYEENDLNNIVSKINGGTQIKENQSELPKVRFFAGTGLNMSKASYSGSNILAGPTAHTKTTYTPLLTAGLDLFANPAIGKMIYRMELSIFRSKNEITGAGSQEFEAIRRHTFTQLTAALAPQVIYNFYNTSPVKVFAGAGIGLNFSKYSNNLLTRYNSFRQENNTEDPVQFELFNYSPQFTLGAVVHKRLEFSGTYSLNSAITNYNYYNISMKRVLISAKYLFGKH
jgi:hypothetical protein